MLALTLIFAGLIFISYIIYINVYKMSLIPFIIKRFKSSQFLSKKIIQTKFTISRGKYVV